MNKTLDLYTKLQEDFPKSAYDKIKVGPREMTTIDAYHIVDRMNKTFGLCGIGWGFENLSFTVHDHDVSCEGCIWYITEQHKGSVFAVGDAPYYKEDKHGNPKHYSIAEAKKKAQTNLLSKASSFLGIGLNVFMGEFDSDPYKARESYKYSTPENQPYRAPVAPPPASAPADLDSMIDGFAEAEGEVEKTPPPRVSGFSMAGDSIPDFAGDVYYKLPWKIGAEFSKDLAKKAKCRWSPERKMWYSRGVIPMFEKYIDSGN